MVETLILTPFVLDDKILCLSLFEQGDGDGVLFVKMLLPEQRGQRFIDTLKFGVEGTVVELYLFDD